MNKIIEYVMDIAGDGFSKYNISKIIIPSNEEVNEVIFINQSNREFVLIFYTDKSYVLYSHDWEGIGMKIVEGISGKKETWKT